MHSPTPHLYCTSFGSTQHPCCHVSVCVSEGEKEGVFVCVCVCGREEAGLSRAR